MLESLIEAIKSFIVSFGDFGIFFGNFLASSIVPIPSEAVLFVQGASGLEIFKVTVLGTLGSTLGSLVCYYIGRYGRNFLEKYGKYFFVSSEKLRFSERWFKKWGSYTVLVSRIIPVIPFKMFSIASGILKMELKNYFFLTLIGSFPRCFLLAYFGFLVSSNVYLSILAIAILFAIPAFIDRIKK
ncbi:MAG: DedA family protein [Candidatus Aenigmarchaeota archaeon]|nr:DedA family protein [Candidatus Aenigmarchaeota archaeon]